MKYKLFLHAFYVSFVLLFSCSVEPAPINYGDDHCFLCDMTVVDKTHAAEYVTNKGRSYTFDAVECLVRKIVKDDNEANMAFVLVADYANQGNLIAAKSATYLISEKIKSPMGANLSAFSEVKTAQEFLEEHGGKLFTWEELKTKFK